MWMMRKFKKQKKTEMIPIKKDWSWARSHVWAALDDATVRDMYMDFVGIFLPGEQEFNDTVDAYFSALCEGAEKNEYLSFPEWLKLMLERREEV